MLGCDLYERGEIRGRLGTKDLPFVLVGRTVDAKRGKILSALRLEDAGYRNNRRRQRSHRSTSNSKSYHHLSTNRMFSLRLRKGNR